MPKMKTNRSVYKKFRVTAKGRVKRAQSNRSHNTAKRAPKRMRQLRGMVTLDSANVGRVVRILPHSF